jgi:exoribonuclease R
VEHLSRLERRADEADRYVGTFLKCVYLRDRVGQTFDGLITTVVEFGCFVQLLALGVDGLLPSTSLRDDDYVRWRATAASGSAAQQAPPAPGRGCAWWSPRSSRSRA